VLRVENSAALCKVPSLLKTGIVCLIVIRMYAYIKDCFVFCMCLCCNAMQGCLIVSARWKRRSYRNAKAPVTRAISTTTRRSRFASHRPKSARKSSQSFSVAPPGDRKLNDCWIAAGAKWKHSGEWRCSNRGCTSNARHDRLYTRDELSVMYDNRRLSRDVQRPYSVAAVVNVFIML